MQLKRALCRLTFSVILLFTTLSSAASADILRIGVSDDYPPFTVSNQDGTLTGFDIDIATTLCAHLEKECVFVKYDWQELIPALRNEKFDALIASMSITDKRRELVAFTDWYYSNVVRFIARKGTDFDPAAPMGQTIGVAPSTVAADWLDENYKKFATIELIDGFPESLSALVNEQVLNL